jgi:hypothetical protein
MLTTTIAALRRVSRGFFVSVFWPVQHAKVRQRKHFHVPCPGGTYFLIGMSPPVPSISTPLEAGNKEKTIDNVHRHGVG